MAIPSSTGVVGISDVRMEDDGQQLVEIPPIYLSWAEKVQSSNGGGLQILEKVLADDFVESRMKLEFPNGEEREPVITIGQEVLETMNALWKNCMIVKVLSRHIKIAAISQKLRELWKPCGGMFVVDLLRHFFMVQFDSKDDYMLPLMGGPWRILGSILMV